MMFTHYAAPNTVYISTGKEEVSRHHTHTKGKWRLTDGKRHPVTVKMMEVRTDGRSH